VSKIIGIDLGTTNCCVAVVEGESIQVIPSKEGRRISPNIVSFSNNNERIVGYHAKAHSITNAGNTIKGINRLYGRKFNLPEVQHLKKMMPYEIIEAPNGYAYVRVKGRAYSPQEISGTVLQHLKQSAEDYLGETVTQAVIAVPANFDELQKQIVLEAGEIAGLQVERIIKEPTAAALSYGIGRNRPERVAVYDLGGGTFDLSILEIHNGIVEVLAVTGDPFLGGDDFDERIAIWIIDSFLNETGIDLFRDKVAIERIKEAAEAAKCELSFSIEAVINIPFLAMDGNIPKHFNKTLTRQKFEQLVGDLVVRTIDPCHRALWEASLQPEEIDKVLLVGGQTRAPLIQQIVKEIFGKVPSCQIDPDEVVAMGAARQGAILNGEIKDQILLDVLPMSLGVEIEDGGFVKLIESNSVIPTKQSLTFTTVADYQKSIEVRILQGESDIARENILLGKLELIGIPPTLRGSLPIEVTIEASSNGNLRISVHENLSGLHQELCIKPDTGLLNDEIELLTAEITGKDISDDLKREIEITLSKLESIIHNTEITFKMYGSALSQEEQEDGQEALAAGVAAFISNDIDSIKQALEAVENLSEHLAYTILNMPMPENNINGIRLVANSEYRNRRIPHIKTYRQAEEIGYSSYPETNHKYTQAHRLR
jgi:molecular chaperone DnaK